MAIIKNHLKENFSIIPNEIITAKTLNDGEYRLLLYLYHLPSDWNINQEHLAKEFELSREQINRRLSSLKNKGYLEIVKRKVNKTEWEYDYILNIPIVIKTSQQQMSQQQMSQPTNTNINKILNITNTNIYNTTSTNNNIYEIFEENFCRTLTSIEFEKINLWLEKYGIEKVKKALEVSVINGVRNFRYIETILINWQDKTLEEIEQSLQKPKNEKKEIFDYDWLNDEED